MKEYITYINKEISLILSNEDNESVSKLSTSAHNNLKSLIETLNEVIDKDTQLLMFMFQNLFIAQFLYSINLRINKMNKNYKINILEVKEYLAQSKYISRLVINSI